MSRVLVTGGGGFLGKKLCFALQKNGHEVISIGRRPQKELEQAGIRTVQGDLRKPSDIDLAIEGSEAVFHTAAIAGMWGPRELFESINLTGTQNLLAASTKHQVPSFVFTSSPSVVFDGQSHLNLNESHPYPKQWLCDYPRTKALAEKCVLEQNGKNGILCNSLRPHLIIGSGDPHLIPRLVQRAKQGRLRQVGKGENMVDMVHVDNVVHAHLLAWEALKEKRTGGEAFFITNDEPQNLWNWMRTVLDSQGISLPKARVSPQLAYTAGAALEKIFHWLNLTSEPPMTRFIARQLATDHTYDISKAKSMLGYRPLVSMKEATQEIIADLKTSHA